MNDPRLHHQPFHSLFLLVLLLGAVSTASASPLFSIGHGTGTSWNTGIANGNVRVAGSGGSVGVLDPGTAAFAFYTSPLVLGQSMGGDPIGKVVAANVTLLPDVQVSDAGFGGTDSFDSLVMTWDEDRTPAGPPAGTGILNVAAWDYVYDVDPDLNGLEIKFSLLAPPGVWDFSLELFDVKGSSVGWFGVPPGSTWNSVVIDPSVQAAQGPFTAFFSGANPAGVFELDKVAFIRLNESSATGISFGTFPVPPGGGPAVTGPWNAWNHLAVVTPEPASLLLMAAGILALVWLRSRDWREGRRR